MQLPQLIRIRWAVRAALMLGVAASVAANVLHARPNLISQTISAWPPLALLLTVELTSRIPMHRKGLAALRVSATGVIAGIAAWVSYWHMQDVAVRYGETKMSAYLLPISVDGLIVVASVSLVELAGRIRFLEDSKPKAAARSVEQALATSALTDSLTPEMAANETSVAPVSPAVAFHPTSRPPSGYSGGAGPGPNGGRGGARAAVATGARTMVTAAANGESAAPRQRRPALETAELADAIEALNPDISQTELASQLGISVSRLKAVRREAEELRRANPTKRS